MKIWILFIILSTPFFAYCVEDTETKQTIDSFMLVSNCLAKIPDSEIINPEHKVSKELSLITSVIESLSVEFGTNDKGLMVFQELYRVAYKHCSTEINTLREQFKGTANKPLKQDK
ncbi:hypothetical protein AADZ86_05305 [Colwelliaceae bacterium BS250]